MARKNRERERGSDDQMSSRSCSGKRRLTYFSSCSYSEYLGMVGYDHVPIVAYLEDKVPRRIGQFRFDKIQIRHDGLMESIALGLSEYAEGRREDIHINIFIFLFLTHTNHFPFTFLFYFIPKSKNFYFKIYKLTRVTQVHDSCKNE